MIEKIRKSKCLKIKFLKKSGLSNTEEERYDLTHLSLNFHLVLLQVLIILRMQNLMTVLNARKESTGNSKERGADYAVST